MVHTSAIFAQANYTIGFLIRNLSVCPHDDKESAYKGLVRQSWSMVVQFEIRHQNILHQGEPEKAQKRAVRFVIGKYTYETGSMAGILEQLKWESLKIGGKIADS